MRYLAALLYGSHDIRLEEVEMPPLEPGEVIVRLRAATLCATDVKKYRGTNPLYDGVLRDYGPYVLGHEGSGEVVEVGEGVTSVKPGDRIAVQPIINCGECFYCRNDMPNLCPRMLGVGGSAGDFRECVQLFRDKGVGGCFAEYLKVPERCVIRVPQHIGYDEASMLEPVADVVHSVDVAGTGSPLRKRVAVVGLGPMGLLHVMVARAYGADFVIGIDPIEERRKLAEESGANVVLDPLRKDPVSAVRDRADQVGVDVVFVTAGGSAQAKCVADALDMVRKGGAVVVFASAPANASLSVDPNAVHYRMISLLGVVGFRSCDAVKGLDLISRDLINLGLIRRPVVHLPDISRAFSLYGTPGVLKVGVQLD